MASEFVLHFDRKHSRKIRYFFRSKSTAFVAHLSKNLFKVILSQLYFLADLRIEKSLSMSSNFFQKY